MALLGQILTINVSMQNDTAIKSINFHHGHKRVVQIIKDILIYASLKDC